MVRRTGRTIPRAAAYLLAAGLVILNSLTAIQLTAFNLEFYRSSWVAEGIPEYAGMTIDDLIRAGRTLLDYFSGKVDSPQQVLPIDGSVRPLFNDRELKHLADVKSLFRSGLILQGVAAAESFGIILFLWKAAQRRLLGAALLGAAAVSLSLLAALAIPANLDFGSWWIGFHVVAFSNDLWLLDPATDWLIRMFPEEFFVSAVTRIGLYSAAISVLYAALGLLVRHFSADDRH